MAGISTIATKNHLAYQQKFSTIFQNIPQEIIFHIINQFPLDTPYEIRDAIQKMHWFSKVELEKPAVFHSIPARKFAKWVVTHQLAMKFLFLHPKDASLIYPLLPSIYQIPYAPTIPLNVLTKNLQHALKSSSSGQKIFTSVPLEDFAKWIDLHQVPLEDLSLKQEELLTVIPFLSYVNIKFNKNSPERSLLFNQINPLFLKKLCISCNIDSIPESLEKLKNFQNLESLCYLTNGGKLPRAFLKVLKCLPRLIDLDLSQVIVPYRIVQKYPYPLHLKKLSLRRSDLEIYELKPFKNLQILSLPGTFLFYHVKYMHDLFNHLPHLVELHIPYHTQITGKEFLNCKLANTLKVLTFHHAENPLEIASIQAFSQLESLDLSSSIFSNEALTQVLQSCAHLKNLRLSNTQITGNEFINCASAGSLQTLYLTGCKKLNSKHLEQFIHLKTLMISKSSVPVEIHAHLTQILPRCDIIFV